MAHISPIGNIVARNNMGEEARSMLDAEGRYVHTERIDFRPGTTGAFRRKGGMIQ